MESRLQPIVREKGFESISNLINDIKIGQDKSLHIDIVDALTTNETSFFRDVHPFECLKKTIIPKIIDSKADKQLNIWCAASSSGQEPYSIAIILKEHFPVLNTWKINFIASDISSRMLKKAQQGLFSQLEVNRGLPMPYLIKYFDKTGKDWQLKPDIINMIKFDCINLKDSWHFLPLDLVFMRNVLIYFDLETRRKIVSQVKRSLVKQGYFFIGGSESLYGVSEDFDKQKDGNTAYYQKHS